VASRVREILFTATLAFLLAGSGACKHRQEDSLLLEDEGDSTVDNGGDLVKCEEIRTYPWNRDREDLKQLLKDYPPGWHFYDYLIPENTNVGERNEGLLRYDTWQAYMDHILGIFEERFPKHLPRAKSFYSRVLKYELGAPYNWEGTTGVAFLDDYPMDVSLLENHLAKGRFPQHCLKLGKGDRREALKNVVKTVIRRTRNNAKITFIYDTPELLKLQQNSLLEYSLLMTHEFLWDFTKDANINRRFNRFLHAKEPNPDLYANLFRNLGLSARPTIKIRSGEYSANTSWHRKICNVITLKPVFDVTGTLVSLKILDLETPEDRNPTDCHGALPMDVSKKSKSFSLVNCNKEEGKFNECVYDRDNYSIQIFRNFTNKTFEMQIHHKNNGKPYLKYRVEPTIYTLGDK